MKRILKIIGLILLIMIIIYCNYFVVEKVIYDNDDPSFFGYHAYIVLSGSMEPTIKIGDIVFAKQEDKIEKDDIIVYKEDGGIITHRVVDVIYTDNNELYITKGDANNSKDALELERQDILGTYHFKIPLVGNIVLFLRTKMGLAFLTLLIIIFIILNIDFQKPKEL